jgi:hypothetical protein
MHVLVCKRRPLGTRSTTGCSSRVIRQVIHRRNQLHEIGFMKLETMVLTKNAELNFVYRRSYTEWHETMSAQLLFRWNYSLQFYDTDFMKWFPLCMTRLIVLKRQLRLWRQFSKCWENLMKGPNTFTQPTKASYLCSGSTRFESRPV